MSKTLIAKLDLNDMLAPGDELVDGAEITLPNGEKFTYKKGEKIKIETEVKEKGLQDDFELQYFTTSIVAPFGKVEVKNEKGISDAVQKAMLEIKISDD